MDWKLSGACFLVSEHNGQQLAYLYFDDERSRRSAAKLLSKDVREGSWSISRNCQASQKPSLLRPIAVMPGVSAMCPNDRILTGATIALASRLKTSKVMIFSLFIATAPACFLG